MYTNNFVFQNYSELGLKSTSTGGWGDGRPGDTGIRTKPTQPTTEFALG